MASSCVLLSFIALICVSNALEMFEGTYGSGRDEHYRFGFEVGTKYQAWIKEKYQTMGATGLLADLRAYRETEDGTRTYETMLYVHNKTFPMYIAELEGIAVGSGVDFKDVFVWNIRESFDTVADPWTASKEKIRTPDQCSDYVLHPYEAHNEDGDRINEGKMYFVNATIGNTSFVGYTYPGDLVTGAFGFNSYHIGFTLNYVAPYAVDEHGLGRGFISRDLLTATSLQDAIERCTTRYPHATGHNFQLMDFSTGRIVNIESAPFLTFNIREILPNQPFFHANAYLNLTVKQDYDASSRHRLDRIHQLPKPTSPKDLLTDLGDQEDKVQPIFHDEKSLKAGDQSGVWTLTTMLFNVEEKTAKMYQGNPREENVIMTFTDL
eukprot:m.14763 g.14763  ORF g.14763 m.14763 type:complete len:380 (+) comp5198_c0_seq1:28-1167(+)